MKTDFDFLKKILAELENNDSHLFKNNNLARALNINLSDDSELDRFVGHIRLLADNNCIECMSHDLGFKKTWNDWIVVSVDYRLTSQGLQFSDILKENTIISKIKKYSLPIALEIGKAMLLSKIS